MIINRVAAVKSDTTDSRDVYVTLCEIKRSVLRGDRSFIKAERVSFEDVQRWLPRDLINAADRCCFVLDT